MKNLILEHHFNLSKLRFNFKPRTNRKQKENAQKRTFLPNFPIALNQS